MATPPLLDTSYLFGSPQWVSDQSPWDLPVKHIQTIQNAFVSYMEHGLSLEHIVLHLDNSKHGMPDESLLNCAMAYCAATVSIPHPRLPDLLLYVREATNIHDDYAFWRCLKNLFDYNPLRKYEVMAMLDSENIRFLTSVSKAEVEDGILAYVINDKAVADVIIKELSTTDRPKAFEMVRYFPDRVVGYIEDHPELLGHREVIARLAVQSKAIMGMPDGTANLYDRNLWLSQPRPSLDEPWSIKKLRSEAVDHGILDLDQTIRTLKALPAECISSLLDNLSTDVTQPVPLIDKLMSAFDKAGISHREIFFLMCLKKSRIDFLDQQMCSPAPHEEYIRQVLSYFNSWHPLPLKQIAENLIRQVPLTDIIDACTSDSELKVAYGFFRDKRLLLKMSGPARDKAFGADIGL